MKQEKLRNEFEKLHNRLKNLKNVDEETKEALENLDVDIQNVLKNSHEKIIDEKESIIKNFKNYAIKFESKHPEITESLNIVIQTLSNLGI